MSVLTAIWPFRRSRSDDDASKLLAAVTQVARQAAFFGEGRVADTLEGRLELMTLHASLAFMRLRAEAGAAPMAQAFADQLFRQFDSGLREAGVGDLAVPKRMHKIAGRFYARLKSYSDALEAGDPAALEASLARNLLGAEPAEREAAFAGPLAGYAAAAQRMQAAQPVEAMFRLDGWPPAPG